MEQKPRARYDEFSEQFTTVLSVHWPDILKVIDRNSPRVAGLLQNAQPLKLRRQQGTWQIQVLARHIIRQEKLSQPRDNEIVAQAIRTWAHSKARLKLPQISIQFDL